MRNRGFSLLELIVAMGVFSIAAVVVVGSFISLLDAQRRAVANQTAMDNIRFAMDAMAKEIRTGSNYANTCSFADYIPATGVKPFPCPAIKFINAKKEEVFYRWRNIDGSVIEKAIDPVLSFSCIDNFDDPIHSACPDTGKFLAITDEKVRIDDLKFYIIGNAPGDGLQPYVVINIEATVNPNNPKARTEIALQTAVSQFRLQP